MRPYLVKQADTKLGYVLKVVSADGTETVTEITATDPKNPKVLKLPDNPATRKWITPKGDEVQELEYKATKTLAPRTNTGAQAPKATNDVWVTYLDEADQEIVNKLKEKALNRKKVADLKAAKAELERQRAELEGADDEDEELEDLGELLKEAAE